MKKPWIIGGAIGIALLGAGLGVGLSRGGGSSPWPVHFIVTDGSLKMVTHVDGATATLDVPASIVRACGAGGQHPSDKSLGCVQNQLTGLGTHYP